MGCCRIEVTLSYAMIVPPYRVEICVHYLTFGGVTMLCSSFVDQTCISKSEKYIVWFRPLFAALVCVWDKLMLGAWQDWKGTL